MTMGETVGVIGLGNIGGAIARNLIADGHVVIVHDTDPARARAITGAKVVDSPAAVGERLRAYRLAAGLSQAALGRKAGVSSGSVSEWERGQHCPRPGQLRRLAGALGVAVADLDPDRG